MRSESTMLGSIDYFCN